MERAKRCGEGLALGLFLVGVLLITMVRGELRDVMGSALAGQYDYSGQCLVCQRTTAWAFWMVHAGLKAISNLFFLDPGFGPLAVASPWGYAPATENRDAAIWLFSIFGARLLMALPLYLLVRRLFASPFARLACVVLLLCILGGWPAAVVNAVFTFGKLFADWPPAYYNFSQPMLAFDWAAVGFIPLLVLVLDSRERVAFHQVALLAAFGQSMMDHLGFITGVTAALLTLVRGQGMKRAALHVAVAGLCSVAVLAVIGLKGGLTMERIGMEQAVAAAGPMEKIRAYFGFWWEVQAKYNFQWLNLTIANFISLAAPALAGGVLLGLLVPARGEPAEARGRLAAVLGCCTAAIVMTLLIGMFKSGYGSDMGRQVIPFLMMASLWLAVGLRDRRAGR
ncbi:hypothetical protein WV31_13260 [Magnetospirillum sp. ME-1]|uniref:hypothetical protein n=1 Tax=Magnetospirillum sp. ME-1 TaxID=1639348 RepID=UPI000A17E3D3|nr:hypothetical protein [Magnetospirillum sp. ME-1]ARJ66568.1 hypothetical protein WV31_13260 [Magnetospirillum sp. ME-1]